ncbi:MAG: hypothetical protein ACQESN_11875, partial [Thermotogota bacterium]
MGLLSNISPYQKGVKFFLVIPLINAIAYSLVYSVSIGGLSLGEIRGIIVGSFFIWFFLSKNNIKNTSYKIIVVFFVYLFFVGLFSSNILLTLDLYLKVFFSTTLFLVGLYYVKSINILKRLNEVTVLVMLIFVLSAFSGILFGFGSGYSGATVLGDKGPNIAKTIANLLLIFPVIFKFNYPGYTKGKQLFVSLVFLLGAFVILIALKRSALLALLIGLFSYFVVLKNKV